MRYPRRLTVFALSASAWMVALTLLWTQVSPWTSYPVSVLSHIALEHGAPMWVRTVHKSPGLIEVNSAIEIVVPGTGGRRAEVSLEANPGRYAYGLPVLLALLLAARGPRRWVRALGGYLLLLPVQAFSLTLYLLMQLVLSTQASARVLAAYPWQIEAIVYGYQMGSLVLPTLVPIVLWLWLDREFFTDVVLTGWRQRGVGPTPS